MTRVALHGSLLAALLAFGLPAYAQTKATPSTSAASAPTSAASPPTSAASPPTSAPESAADLAAKPGIVDSSDTRGASMRAYQAALDKQKLAASQPLSSARIRDELGSIEEKLASGRRDEAISDLVYIVESPRFEPFKNSDEGRAAIYWLGDALGRGGAYQPARGYLSQLLTASASDIWYRRAVHSLVDLALESDEPQSMLDDLKGVGPGAPDEVSGDVAYLTGRVAELDQKPDAALRAYQTVSEKSRFWAQATYLSGVIAVERKDYKQGESLFCKVADPKQTPKKAALFGGTDFFRVRDLARLGLGRVAHEQYRFDDARYYYYLVPHDSNNLPEALYETATTRYEAKDYEGAREYMDELKSLDVAHPYQDEAWLLDAYIDLATCHFPDADAKLAEFLLRYEPVRNAARRLVKDESAMQKLVEAVRLGSDPAAAGIGSSPRTARALGALLRIDARYNRATLRLARLDHQMRGLLMAMGDLDEAGRRLSKPNEMRPQAAGPLGQSDYDKVQRIEAQLSEVKRLMSDIKRAGGGAVELKELEKQAEALTVRVKAAKASVTAGIGADGAEGKDLGGLIAED